MTAPRSPDLLEQKDANECCSVHVLLFQCPKCDGPIVACTVNEYFSLEMGKGNEFQTGVRLFVVRPETRSIRKESLG